MDKKEAHFAGGPEGIFMQHHPTIRRPVSPKKTQAALHKQFYQRLSNLSDADQGKLSMAIIERFLHLDRQGKR